MEIIIIVTLLIFASAKIYYDFKSCTFCNGTGKDSVDFILPDGKKVTIRRGICPQCHGSGQRDNK